MRLPRLFLAAVPLNSANATLYFYHLILIQIPGRFIFKYNVSFFYNRGKLPTVLLLVLKFNIESRRQDLKLSKYGTAHAENVLGYSAYCQRVSCTRQEQLFKIFVEDILKKAPCGAFLH